MRKLNERKGTKWIVIHCSATRPSQDISVETIDRWHRAKGWWKVGYHYVIKRDGTIQKGRGINEVGAHVYPPPGVNSSSVGICLVGGVSEDDISKVENNFTEPQWKALEALVESLEDLYPDAVIVGHRYFDKSRGCPSFDVNEWLSKRKKQQESQVIDTPFLKKGSKGVAVEVLQHRLKITVDGIFGGDTEKAVKDFQKKNKLEVDGIVGPNTWRKLENG